MNLDLFPDALTLWTAVAAMSTLLAVLVALFIQPIRQWILRPKLKVEFEHDPPFIRNEFDKNTKHIKTLSLKVTNTGQSVANGAIGRLVLATNVHSSDHKYEANPRILHWNTQKKDESVDIYPGQSYFLNILYSRINELWFHIATMESEEEENMLVNQNIDGSPVTYRLKVMVFAQNSKPVAKTISIKLKYTKNPLSFQVKFT